MIMGEICTRRCPFCDVGHGRPLPLDKEEPQNMAETIQAMQLKYVVITSVDRDDLRDGGAEHFVECIEKTRTLNPQIKIETLVPDFRGRVEVAIDILKHPRRMFLIITSKLYLAYIKRRDPVPITRDPSTY